MKKNTKSTVWLIAAGLGVVALAISMKGMIPELIRYIKIEKM